MRDPEPDCWLHEAVEVRRSDVAGRGLFATADLPAGVTVSQLGGRLVDGATVRGPSAGREENADRMLERVMVAEGRYLIVAPGDNRFGNHGCDPNLGWVDEYALATMTDVSAGDELLVDYAMSIVEPDWFLRCHCPSYRCRQMVEGTDWRILQLQQRYDGCWTPYVQGLVDASGGRGS